VPSGSTVSVSLFPPGPKTSTSTRPSLTHMRCSVTQSVVAALDWQAVVVWYESSRTAERLNGSANANAPAGISAYAALSAGMAAVVLATQPLWYQQYSSVKHSVPSLTAASSGTHRIEQPVVFSRSIVSPASSSTTTV